MMHLLRTLLALTPLYIFSTSAYSDNVNISQHTQSFSLVLGASRVIYHPDSRGYSLQVMNEQDYPMLVQTKIKPDKELPQSYTGNFTAIPPLFRLDANQRAKIRIINTGGNFPGDRESLYWICVKGIPPSNDDAWAAGEAPQNALLNVKMMVSNCIKLFVRPKTIANQNTLAMAEKLKWKRENNSLIATNESPLYINLSSLSVGETQVENVTHIAPFSSQRFDIRPTEQGEIKWRAISEQGGQSNLFQAMPE